jgi:hypothetical protein
MFLSFILLHHIAHCVGEKIVQNTTTIKEKTNQRQCTIEKIEKSLLQNISILKIKLLKI